MVGLLFKIGLTLVIGLAVLYQTVVKDYLLLFYGIGREIQPVSDFPYQCRRIQDPRLSACEDMWFSEATRKLLLACSDPSSRRHWLPNMGFHNVSGRSLHDAVIALDVDKPDGDSFEYEVLSMPDFHEPLHLLGLTGGARSRGFELYLVNSKPSVDPATGALLDQENVGANSTIEHFKIDFHNNALLHLGTFANDRVVTPNNIALSTQGGIYFTNDHGVHKTGLGHTLSPIIGSGDLSYCDAKYKCKRVASGLKFPNGLALARDGLLYVPSTVAGGLHVYEPHVDGSAKKLGVVDVPYSIDNLSVDGKKNIIIAAFPIIAEVAKAFSDPYGYRVPSTILKLYRDQYGNQVWEKLIEDRDGKVLPLTTTAIHDAKTGRLFLSSIVSPFITVCDPEKKKK
ncbi:calcium-dependent phosphotriesterase [Polychaeton citri CBS 116435]|uniref:Calcium-dependent phosphotriesterase n=1 Tax=Polychaeton citri CBS 116435 TaxID=1314669 RepID=A0A9P4Q3Y5_9PEZI|nr:calcium-dependent phosphotriesterase [Polychaeton citri CBS 116435]